jgi:ribosomal protein S14
MPISATFATTPSARSSRKMSPNGMSACASALRTATDGDYDRQALRYIIRNTTFPQRVRAQAQLQLSQMHCYTRFTQIKNRCIMGGKGRGVFSDFRLGRVRITGAEGRNTTLTKFTVPVPSERACRKSAGCEEGKLVDASERWVVIYVYTTTGRHNCIGRRFICEKQNFNDRMMSGRDAPASVCSLTCCGSSKRGPAGQQIYVISKLTYARHKQPSIDYNSTL